MQLGTPEAVGMSSQRLNRIQPVMQAYIDQGKFPGLITMIARRGKVVHFDAFGWMDVEAKKPMQKDTLFFIASMTKPITALTTMMLYEEGHFQLNDPISHFIPAFKDVKVFVKSNEDGVEVTEPIREITIRDLLTHTSGLGYDFHTDSPVGELYRQAKLQEPGYRLKELVHGLSQLPLFTQPGSAWRYSFSQDILAHMIENISGIPYEHFLQEKIFTPLQMIDTGFYVPGDKRQRFATFYKRTDDGGFEPSSRTEGDFASPAPGFGGHGLISTASDYMRFAQLMLNGGRLDDVRLLSRKTVELMTQNHLSAQVLPTFDVVTLSKGYYTKGYGHGFGMRVLMDAAQNEIVGSVGSYGWGGALNTYFWVDPKEQLVGMVWGQIDRLYYYPLERQFMALVYQAIID